MNTLVVNFIGREKRYALIKEKKVEKLVIGQPKQQSSVGEIYLGTVTKVLPGMNAAFIDIGKEKNGYLHRDKVPAYVRSKENKSISSYLHQGEKILVQVEKDETGNKGPRLTGILEFNGRSTVYMPKGVYVAVSKKIEDSNQREHWREFGLRIRKEDEGILFRTACVQFSENEIEREIENLRKDYEEMVRVSQTMKKPGLLAETNSLVGEILAEMAKLDVGEVIVDQPELKAQLTSFNSNEQIKIKYYQQKENIFSVYGLEHEIEKALKRVVWLDQGAYLIFDEAEALTIIDVNTGKFSGKNDLQETVIKTNQWAAEEIARQIRLRDIGGMILIDFIDMKNESDREKVMKTLERSLRNDDRRTRIIGFTPLGILQMTRKKTKVSISEGLTTKCEVCGGTGRVLSPETIAFQLERELWELKYNDEEAVLIETTAEVKNLFAGPHNVHQQRLQEAIGLRIYFTFKESPKPFYSIRQMGNQKDIRAKATE